MLEDKDRKKLEKLRNELGEIQTKASANKVSSLDETRVALSRAELEGTSDDFIATLEPIKGKKDQFFVSMKAHVIEEAMKLIKSSDVRKKLTAAQESVAMKENGKLLKKMVEMRTEIAKLLGYESFGDMALEDSMAQTPAKVESFIDSLYERIHDKSKKDMDKVRSFVQDETHGEIKELNSWDLGYWGKKYKVAKLNVDEDEVKEYFPAEHVVEETMQIYQELLGLKFQKSTCEAWTKDISCYKVFDDTSNEFMGLFYLDLYPREGKYNHAAVFPIIQRSVVGEDVKRATSAMVVNFNPAKEGQPPLMLHHEVSTFFHEFGHVMHSMCSKADFSRFSNFGVERDFVELPSQMLENWTWDPRVLARLSSHWETGKPLPADLIARKVEAKTAFEAVGTVAQLFQSTFDLILHSPDASGDKKDANGIVAKERKAVHKKHAENDSQAMWGTLKLDMLDMQMLPETNPAASFDHLFGGYESQYYGYLWS